MADQGWRTRLLRYFSYLLAGLMVLGLVGLALGLFFVTQVLDVQSLEKLQSARSQFESHLPQILEDLRFLEGKSPFLATPGTANADALLSQHTSFVGASADTSAVTEEARRLLETFRAHKAWATDAATLDQLRRELAAQGIATDWVAETRKFDHWNFLANPVYEKELARVATLNGLAKMSVFAHLSIPNFEVIRSYATARVLTASGVAAAREALADYRHVAVLLQTTGDLVGSALAVAMLQQEPLLAEAMQVLDWTPVPADVLKAYRGVSWALTGIANHYWTGGLPDELKPFLRREMGACAGAFQFAGGAGLLDDLFGRRVPLERDFTGSLSAIRDMQKDLLKQCQLTQLEAFLEPSSSEAQGVFIEAPANAVVLPEGLEWARGLTLNPSRIPFLRQSLGLTLQSVATPSFTRYYEEPGESANQDSPSES